MSLFFFIELKKNFKFINHCRGERLESPYIYINIYVGLGAQFKVVKHFQWGLCQ